MLNEVSDYSKSGTGTTVTSRTTNAYKPIIFHNKSVELKFLINAFCFQRMVGVISSPNSSKSEDLAKALSGLTTTVTVTRVNFPSTRNKDAYPNGFPTFPVYLIERNLLITVA